MFLGLFVKWAITFSWKTQSLTHSTHFSLSFFFNLFFFYLKSISIFDSLELIIKFQSYRWLFSFNFFWSQSLHRRGIFNFLGFISIVFFVRWIAWTYFNFNPVCILSFFTLSLGILFCLTWMSLVAFPNRIFSFYSKVIIKCYFLGKPAFSTFVYFQQFLFGIAIVTVFTTLILSNRFVTWNQLRFIQLTFKILW